MVRPKQLPKYIHEQDMLRLLRAPHKDSELEMRDYVILMTLYHTGMRNSELRNLKVRDIDFYNGTLTVVKGKGGKDRVIPIVPAISPLLEEIIGDRTEGYVFQSMGRKKKDGERRIKSIGTLDNIIKKYAKRAGLKGWQDYHVHMIRHTFAVQSLKNGRSINDIRMVLGHSSLTTTQIYLELAPQDLAASMIEHPLPS